MKKTILIFILLIVVSIICLYTLIPTNLKIVSISYINCPDNAAGRFLSDEAQWKKWWPDSSAATSRSFHYNGTSFTVKQKSFNGTILSTSFNGRTLDGNLAHVTTTNDSMAVAWQYPVTMSRNPMQRIQEYMEARKLKKNTSAILARLKEFLENREKVYGIAIREIRVTDTLLVSRFFESANAPSVDAIYASINQLKSYIAANGASETGFPMLNVSQIDSSHFKTRVAIPVNRSLKEVNGMEMKKMIPGRILVTEIKGGPARIREGFLQLGYFQLDYSLASPAIPFESLLTNRIQEKDSTKWITRLYYPIL